MKKKWWLLGVTIFIVVGILIYGYYFYTNYQYKGSVEYSVSQLEAAFKSQNTVLIAQYFDANSVVDNFWNSYNGLSYVTGQNALSSSIINGQENSTKSNMLNGWQQAFTSTTDNGTIEYFIMQNFLANRGSFTINGDTATKEFDFTSGPMYVFTFVLTQQPDRTWKITDIRGLDDYIARSYADNTRSDDLEAIGSLLVAYQSDYHTLPLPASLDTDLTNTQFDIKSQVNQSTIETVLEDPLSAYGNKYVYAVDNQSNPQYFVLEAKISSDNTTLAAQSKYTTTVYGVDCSFPSSYCIGTATTTATTSSQ